MKLDRREIMLRILIIVAAALILTFLDWLLPVLHVSFNWSIAIAFWVGAFFNAAFFTTAETGGEHG